MPRRTKPQKAYIVVFCEGESEQAYMDFLKKEFHDVASIKRAKSKGLFEEADSKFKKDRSYRDYAEVTDEIWFFFDVESKDISTLDNRFKIVKRLKSLRKKPEIRVRLLMTTGCIEYWLMLHYEMFAPSIRTVAEKEQILKKLQAIEPNYKKGDAVVTAKIAKKYPTAVENAKRTISNLLQDGLPGLKDTDERNRWLCEKCYTFSTVYEAIDFLTNL